MKLDLKEREFISFKDMKIGEKFRRRWFRQVVWVKGCHKTAVCLVSGIVSIVPAREDCEIVDGEFTCDGNISTFGDLKVGECFYRHGKGGILSKYIKCQVDDNNKASAFCIYGLTGAVNEFFEVYDHEIVSRYTGEFKEN